MDSQREVEILDRIAVLERKVDQLMRRTSGAGAVERSGSAEGWGFDHEPDPADASDLRALVQAGNKIEAIQRYRERTGVGLKEAKDAIERLEPQA